MDPYVVLLLVLFLFVLLFGASNLLRREPFSLWFVVEALLGGGLILLAAWLAQAPPSPILYFVALYLLTMRARVLIDVGNLLAQRGRLRVAGRLYQWAWQCTEDPVARRAVRANQGAALLLGGRVDAAVATLEEALAPEGGLGIRQEAASRYNLGLAYLKLGRTAAGQAQLHEAASLLPGSVYGRQARRTLERLSEPRESSQARSS